MFEKFTDRARKVIDAAQAEARRLNHERVGTEHLLLALLRDDGGLAVIALTSLKLNAAKARVAVEERIRPGPAGVTIGDIPYGMDLKIVLAHAMYEAEKLRHRFACSEHLLLGLLSEKEGMGGQALRTMGVSAEAFRREVVTLLGQGIEPLDIAQVWAQDVMRYAWEKAPDDDIAARGTALLLLMLMMWEEGLAARILQNLGVTSERVKAEAESLSSAESQKKE